MKRIGLVVLTLALLAAGGFAFLYSGLYDVAATKQHTRFVFWVLDTGLRTAVRERVSEVNAAPNLDDPQLIQRGLRCFRQYCVQCHGAPGVPPDAIGKSLLPLPANLVQTAREWPPEHIYWVTKEGLRMTGMPAWEYRLSEEDLWAVVALVERLPLLTSHDYAVLDRSTQGTCSDTQPRAPLVPLASQADPARGPVLLRQYACTSCHRIPGVVGPDAHVGPPLTAMGERKYLAGVLPNTTENMIRWLRDPQSVSARTLMPDQGVTEAHARDIAAYLATLRR